LVGSVSSVVTVPLSVLKVPRTVDTVRWRTANWTLLCAGSICHVAADAEEAVARIKPRTAERSSW